MTNENEPQPTTPETAITATPDAAAAPPAQETAITLPRSSGAPVTDAAQSVPMTPPPAAESTGVWLDKLDWILLGLVVALAVLVASIPAANADVWMHLATGRLIAHGEYFPGGADPYSCATEAGDGREAVPWINHSWLYALGLYGLYSAFGGMGVIIAKASLIGALTILLMFIRSRDTHLLLIAVCLTLTVLAIGLRLVPLQPVLVSYVFLGVTLLLLHRAGVFDGEAPPEPATPDAPTTPTASTERWLWGLPVLCLLWVNLDNWFILGPIVVALSWAGLGLQRWRGQASRVPVSRLGLVLGVCLLACLVNPFHVRAFQLPPELAYLAVWVGDQIGLPLPDAIFGGGRTLAILHDAQPQLGLTLSPLASGYLSNPALGYTIAGVCFFPLLGLGLLSFTLNGLLGGKPGAPALQPARFLVWLFFAVLATLLYRLIPFFVIVAGPITALNLGDLFAWYIRPTAAGAPDTPWVAPIRLARLLGVLLLAALLLLAWPGWLTGPQEWGTQNQKNHVGWDIPVDPSLRAAAERLDEIQREPAATPRHMHVYSTGWGLSCYCAWYAPGVKGFFDVRYNLFPHTVGDFIKAKVALSDKRRPPSEWSPILNRYQIDHVAVEATNALAFMPWWREPARWLQQFADGHVAVFAWSGDRPHWRDDAVLEGWNRLAFGPVPESGRPPKRGMPEAPENRTLWDRYLEPPPPLTAASLDMDAKLAYGMFSSMRVIELAHQTLPSAAPVQVLPMYSLGAVPLSPGTMSGPWAMAVSLATIRLPELKGKPFYWSALDSYPPAVPILVARRAWQAVNLALENERCYYHVNNAMTLVQQQEDAWIRSALQAQNFYGAPPPRTLRSALRLAQRMAALRAAIEVGLPDPKLQFRVHKDLADLYRDAHHLDLAAEHYELADKALDAAPPDDSRLQDEWRKDKKQVAELNKVLHAEVEERKRAFDMQTATRKEPMERVQIAIRGTFSRFNKENQAQSDPNGWGLTGMTLQLLQDIDPQSLPTKEQQAQWGQFTIDLFFRTGHARAAADVLEKFKTAIGPSVFQYQVFSYGTQGNYDELRSVLKNWDQLLAAQARNSFLQALSTGVTAPTGALGQTYYMLGLTTLRPGWVDHVSAWSMASNECLNIKTLRGAIALEAGDTAEARRVFDEVLREAAGAFFIERPIAERYAPLLARYQK